MYIYLSPLQDQYKLCFEILQSHLDSFDTYANFKAVWVWSYCVQWTKFDIEHRDNNWLCN